MAYSDACRKFYNLVKNNSSSEAKQFYDEKCVEIDVNQRNYADIFNYVCENGDLELAKWFLELNKEDYPVTYTTAFYDACMNNNLEVAKWLFQNMPKINFPFHYYDYMFQKLCVPEKLEMAKFLLEIIRDNDILMNYFSIAFQHACINGCLEIAQNLLEKNPDNSYDFEIAFNYAFQNEHLDVVKWLFSVKPSIVISADCMNLFKIAVSRNNNFEMAKWMYSIKSTSINISVDNEYLFRVTCKYGNIELAKWLLEMKPDINISVNNDYAFHCACKLGHLEIAQWLYLLKPDIDISSIDRDIDNDEINDWLETIRKIVLPIDQTKKINLDTISDKSCPICYEATVSIQTNCGHNFCKDCIETVYKKKSLLNKCSCCRSDLNKFYLIE